ncbi:MAG: lamin tail domain-containing protein [Candidatus Cloacimonetes bacterium]|nr:lamin tail domain-containing protein [Candidatus Cloacimonadota bacterium]
MKKVIILALLMSLSILAFAQFNDLIFSEYIEGSSYNKAFEIYNGTGNEVDLSNYVILQAANGGNYDEYIYWMSGMLANDEVFVFAHGSADPAILEQADFLDNYICNFNGDDFRGLGKIDEQGQYPILGPDGETTINISIIDMIGTYPDDPGDGWDIAGVVNATKDHTLVRKSDVYDGVHGNDEWAMAAGTNADDSQWIVYDSNTFDYLGYHGEVIEEPAIEVTVPNGGEVWFVGETYTITWNNTLFADNVDIYLDLPVRFDIATDIANTGSYEWLIPANAPLSTEILMVVEDAVDADPADMSDAFFTIAEMSEVPEIVINEIMYNPSGDLGDDNYFEYLELYNPGTEAVDMSGCYFIEGIDYTFEAGAMIDAGAYIVLAVNPDSLFLALGVVAYGQFTGALGNSGEDILLATAAGVEIDFVDYLDGGDWPSAPDGSGPSLELISPELDNSLAENWQASYTINGTPGEANSFPTTSIGWGNLQWPYNTQIVEGEITENIYGQVWMDGVTNEAGQGIGITAQVGYGADGSTPGDDWTWFDTVYNADSGANDEYMGNLSGMLEGLYDYTYRYIYEGDSMWYYASEIGNLTVVATPPEEVNITFAVDMQYQTVAPEGVHIAGSFQGWDPAATEMIDDNSDMVYEVTLTLLSGAYHEFKYVNGNAWGSDETNNRNITVPEADSVLTTVLFNDWFPVIDGVFFSEYIEGSSNNKALEIYNGTDETVSLDNFRIAQSVNGGGWAYWHIFPVGAVLDAGDVWVMLNSSTDPTLFDPANADEVLDYPSVVHHNGDDARGLEYSLDGENWALIDVIGDPNNDPGDGWDVAGVATATKDHTLVRKGFVTVGNTDWLDAAGTSAEDGEWEVYPVNTFDYLGYHGEAPELEVVFNVNMNYQIMLQNFDPTINFVDIGGNFNDWGANALVGEDLDEDGIYTMTTMLPLGYGCEFKFRIDGNWDLAEFPGGDNRTYTVIDGENVLDLWFNDEEIPEFTSQDVVVTFTLDMEYVDPALYAGGISIQGSVAPLGWDTGVNLLTPMREAYTIDILFPAGSLFDVEFKFAMMADGATDWVWEDIANRMFTIDDANAAMSLPAVYWNDMIMVTIPEIQTPVDETDVSPYAGQIVSTQGIITAIGADKYWISTPEGGAWNGLYAYDLANMPALGDEILITGLVDEYFGLTEIYNITDFVILSSGNDLPEPAVITTNQLSTEEEWESVLVQVQDVVVTVEVNNYGEWYLDDGSGECQADDAIYHVEPLVGDEFASITGLVNYSYDFYELLPRFEEDLVTGPEWVYGDVTGDWNVDAFDAANMLQFAVQLDPIGAPLPWTWQLIAGDVDGNSFVEAYDAALVLQYSVDLIDVFPVELLRVDVPEAVLAISVENNELVFSATGDFYSLQLNIDPATIQLGTPEVASGVMNAVNPQIFAIALASSEKLSGEIVRLPFTALENQEFITIEYSVNSVSREYRIKAEELESGVPGINASLGNYPNPFNPVTYIQLSVAADDTPVSVKIYNVRGQLVKSLFQGNLDKGIQNLKWNGTDNNGKSTGSGVYFYRTEIGNYSSMSKMLMLK